MGKHNGKRATVAVLEAIEHARQDGYDAGYQDGLVDGSSSLLLPVDRAPGQLVQQGEIRKAG